MKNKIKTCILCLFMVCSLINAQKRQLKKAGKNFNQGAYASAIVGYQNLVDHGNTSQIVFKNLGDSYYFTAAYAKAVDCYQKLLAQDSLTNNKEYLYKHSLSLKSLGAYKESDLLMNKFCQKNPLDPRAIRFLASSDYLKIIEKSSNRGFIENMTLNSIASEFAPSIHKNQLVFASARNGRVLESRINARGNQYLHKLYSQNLSTNKNKSKTIPFSKQLKTISPESTTALSKDGNTLYLTRNSLKNGKLQRDKNGYNRTKIYRTKRSNGQWSAIEELPFNSLDFSVAHPALSPDEEKLYFASDMPGTIGMSDIYSVDLHDDGSFGTPKNIGPQINTLGRDSFPFVSADGQLYFASDGHIGLGGFDIFVAKKNTEEEWCVLNVGEPINSTSDDFSYVFDSQNGIGYFSSNRKGGKGNDDIYSFSQSISLVLECEEVSPEVELSNSEEENVENTTIVKKEQEIPLNTKLTQFLNIDSVLFEFNKHSLSSLAKNSLGEVATTMQKHPEIHVKVQAHTDATGTAAYNILLSEKRAKTVVAYLVQLGVNSNRLSFKGFGESRLINDCSNNKCTLNEKLQNRRVECIVSKK